MLHFQKVQEVSIIEILHLTLEKHTTCLSIAGSISKNVQTSFKNRIGGLKII